MTFETSIDKINMHIHAVYVSGQSDLGLRISSTAEILISLRFSHLNSVHFTFEERGLCFCSGTNKNKCAATF